MKTVIVLVFALGLISSAWAQNTTCAKDNLDVFIVLDSSKTLHNRQYEEFKDFLANLMNHFNIGTSKSRIGLMQFSDKSRAVIEFNLGTHTTRKATQDSINKLVHQQGNSTYLGSALEMVNRKVFPKNDKDKENILILLTDGQPHDFQKAFDEAQKLKKEKGVHMITVAAGTERWVNTFKWHMNRLGSKPTNNQRIKFRNVRKITKKLVDDICNNRRLQAAPPFKCFQEKQDILIMMDGSKTIGKVNFEKMKTLLEEFISRLDIGSDRIHIGLIQYSDGYVTTNEIPLNMYTTAEDVLVAISKVFYHQGTESDLGSGLKLAVDEVFTSRGADRLTAPDMILIFTDGNYNMETVLRPLAKLRAKNKTRIVSIGIEGSLPMNQKNIDTLASFPEDVYDIVTVTGSTLFDNLAPSECKVVHCTTAPPRCTPENQDILILLDGKEKIGKNEFKLALRYLKSLVTKMTLGKKQTHVGIMQYGRTGDVTFEAVLGRDIVRTIITGIISKIKFKNSPQNSDLAYALAWAGRTFRDDERSRKDAPKTVVIISDGDMTDFTEANAIAEDLRNKGIRVIALSYGKYAKNERFVSSMRLLATGPKEYYKLTKAYFNGILKEVQKTVCVSEPLIPESCFQQNRNVFFLLDSSRGRGGKKFKAVKQFMDSLVRRLHLGPTQTRVGFLQFDDDLTTNGIVFNKNDTSETILWRIKTMKHRKGQSIHLGEALKIINEQVFTEDRNQHPDYEDILIIITHKYILDGQLAFNEAEKLKKKGVNVISVATGHKRIAQQVKHGLQVLSSNPSNVHSTDYLALWNIVDDILIDICGLGTCPSFATTSCTPRKQDVLFLVDGSRSIGDYNFFRLKRFLKRLASRLELAKDRTHLGLLQVGSSRHLKFQFDLGEFPDLDDIMYMTEDMAYLDDTSTYIGNALKMIRRKVFNNKGLDRPSIQDTLVIFSDGEAHDSHLMFAEAEKLKKKGVRIMSVGFGTELRTNRSTFLSTLKKVSSDEKDVFTTDFKRNDLSLEEVIGKITKDLVQIDCPKALSPPRVECKQGYIDLFLLVDGSKSIGPDNFKFVKKFLKKLVGEFDLGPKRTHIGLMQFGDVNSESYVFGLEQGLRKKIAKRKIRRMKYVMSDYTKTGDAIRKVDQHIFNNKNGDRPGVPNVLVLFTDGRAHDIKLAVKHARRMRARNIRIVAIAAGEQAKNPKLVAQLESIATSQLDVYTSEFSELTDIVDRLIDIDCEITTNEATNAHE